MYYNNYYADDVLLYHNIIIITCLEDFEILQSDINSIGEWSDDHLLQLNPVKYKCMLISKKKHTSTSRLTLKLFLNDSELEEVSVFKYLEILIKNSLLQ